MKALTARLNFLVSRLLLAGIIYAIYLGRWPEAAFLLILFIWIA